MICPALCGLTSRVRAGQVCLLVCSRFVVSRFATLLLRTREDCDLRFSFCNWATTWQNVSSEVSDQARHKPACAATEASMRLEILAIESRAIRLSKQRTTRMLIRLRGCAGWSAPLLFAYGIRQVFSLAGSISFSGSVGFYVQGKT